MAINNTVKIGAAFLGGAAVGFAVCYNYIKSKCEAERDSYIKSVEETFDNRVKAIKEKYESSDDTPKPKEPEKPKTKINKTPEFDQMVTKITDNNYVDYTDYCNDEDADIPFSSKPAPADEPYVISPNDYSESADYDNQTLYYYSADEMVTDTEGETIENVEELIGTDALNHFGEYEEDSVHVRNEKLRCEYEIILNP